MKIEKIHEPGLSGTEGVAYGCCSSSLKTNTAVSLLGTFVLLLQEGEPQARMNEMSSYLSASPLFPSQQNFAES